MRLCQATKPYGALYNTAPVDRNIADAIAEAVYDSIPGAFLSGLCNGELIQAGKMWQLNLERCKFRQMATQRSELSSKPTCQKWHN